MSSIILQDQPNKLSSFDATTRTFPYLEAWKEKCLSARQQRALGIFTKSFGGICWWKMGQGKTRIALFWFATLQNFYKWSLPSICICIVRRRAFYDWRQEIQNMFPGAGIWENDIPIHPPGNNIQFLLLSEGMVTKLVDVYAKYRTARAVILDELWLYANPESAKSKAAYRFGLGRKSLGLSGTIMKARDTAEVFSQARAVSKHRYLAPNLTNFRSQFQICQAQDGYSSFYPKKGSYQQIMDKLSGCSDVYFPKSDLPITEQRHSIPATTEQIKYLRQLKDYFCLDEHGLEFKNAMATTVKAQQIADGFIHLGEGEFVEVSTFKLGKLVEELDTIVASGERVVVWCAFRQTVELICRTIPFATLQMVGGKDFDVATWERGDIKVCVATEASGSSVNYFRHTPYGIYYSVNYKWKDLEQSRYRHNRKDSRHSECFFKYLCVEGSLDDHVLDVAMGSGDRESWLIRKGELAQWARR